MRAIILTAYKRPHYLKQVLETVRSNNVSGYKLYVGLEPGCLEAESIIYAIDWIPKTVLKNKTRLYNRWNLYSIIEYAINDGNDNLVVIEDDVILAPDAMDLANWYFALADNDYVCMGLFNYHSDPTYPNEIAETDYFIPLGWCVTKKIWEERLKPNWMCDDRGWDWSITRFLEHNKTYKTLHPRFARANHIGREGGEHCTPEFHDKTFSKLSISEGFFRRYFVCRSTDTLPLVTAVMVTGKDRSRYGLAQIAIECFLNQSYPNKELLIINHGDQVLPFVNPTIKELRVARTATQTIGELRNFGIDYAKGDFLIAWDDDDWHCPERISMQMAAQSQGAAVFLKRQIRYSLVNDCAFVITVAEGIHGTILHPRSVSFRYPKFFRGEDTMFMKHFTTRTIVENAPSDYVRFYHGENLWDAKHIMGKFSDSDLKNVWEVDEQDACIIKQITPKYHSVRKQLQ